MTGAAVNVISIHREAFKSEIAPIPLRDLLSQTGTPQSGTQQIGSRPDLKQALRALEVPEVEVGGTLVPGGTLTITNYGTPGDTYGLFLSLSSLPPDQIYVAPAGYLFLDPVGLFVLLVNGTVGAGGSTVVSGNIPNQTGLTGLRASVQGYHVFNSGPGIASFTNYATFKIN